MHLLAKKVSESLISLNLLQSWRQVKDQQEQHGLVDDEALSCFEKQHQLTFVFVLLPYWERQVEETLLLQFG